jgi:signal transduction histidine kinase
MSPIAAPFHPTHTTGSWEDFEQRVGGVLPALALFALVCTPLVWLDGVLREPGNPTALLTPSAGVLFVAVWMSRPSRWPAMVGIYALAALAVRAVAMAPDSTAGILFTILPVPISAVCSALATMFLLRTPIQLAIWQVPLAIIGSVLGGLVGAIAGLLVRSEAGLLGSSFAFDLISLWASLALGAVTLGSVSLMWLLRIRHTISELRVVSWRNLIGIVLWTEFTVLLGVVFLRGPQSVLMAVPIMAGPALILGCFRLPPRWAITLANVFILQFTLIAAHSAGPFRIPDSDVRASLQQFLICIFATLPFMLSIGITQLRIIIARQEALNEQLLKDQKRLRSYARQLAAADERARRTTAVDLHDGIGQSLAGMLMIVEVARQQSQPTVQKLLDEIRVQLREIQELTRRMISDLSPPGLYDLGLTAALQWMVATLRADAGLTVNLDCRLDERRLRLDTRVLAFKLVRELLRNVVKHAGVTTAQVTVEEDEEWLHVMVSDAGRGFEWQMDVLGERSGRFGLWSVADRVREVGGSFDVRTAIGMGARFIMQLPLHGAELVPDVATVRLHR